MNFEEYSEAPCVLPPTDGDATLGKCAGIDSRCLDLEWAANHPEVCPGASAIVGLRVTPATSVVDIGGAVPYFASLVFANGSTKDVTRGSVWDISDGSIAGVADDGLVTGIEEGTTTVQAVYGSLRDYAQVSVVEKCVQAGLDIVLVFDRSAGMGTKDEGGLTVLDLAKRAARGIVESAVLTSGKDRIAIVSCAGLYRDNEAPAYIPQATLHLVLSSVKPDILAAIDSVAMGNCYYDLPDYDNASECATGIGAGLQRARDEIIDHGRTSSRKLIVYIGNGYEVYCNPDPLVIAADCLNRNYQIAGIVVGAPVSHYPCSTGPALGQKTTWEYVQLFVSCNLFWGVSDLTELPAVMTEVLPQLCAIQNDPCVYYVAPVSNPLPVQRYRDQLDYSGFRNWDVIKGFVDLIGIDLYPLQSGHGLYLDMVGTDQSNSPIDVEAVGAIQSKQLFTFGPGRYRITFDIAGNLRFDKGEMSMRVTVGSLLDKTIVVSDWKQQFTRYTYDFSVPVSTAARIVFDHQPLPPRAVKTVGLLLDNIRLVNLDSGIVLIDDSFDSENPL